MYSNGPPHMAVQKQDDQHEHTFSNYVRIQDAVQKTCLRRWTIGKSGERGSGISVLPARHDDDDIILYIFILYMSRDSFVCSELNGFKYCYLTRIVLLAHLYVFKYYYLTLIVFINTHFNGFKFCNLKWIVLSAHTWIVPIIAI